MGFFFYSIVILSMCLWCNNCCLYYPRLLFPSFFVDFLINTHTCQWKTIEIKYVAENLKISFFHTLSLYTRRNSTEQKYIFMGIDNEKNRHLLSIRKFFKLLPIFHHCHPGTFHEIVMKNFSYTFIIIGCVLKPRATEGAF